MSFLSAFMDSGVVVVAGWDLQIDTNSSAIWHGRELGEKNLIRFNSTDPIRMPNQTERTNF
jgi:hypothetical protein